MQERRALRPALTLRRLLLPAVAAVVVAVDQVTKTWALHAEPQRHVVGPLWWWLTFNSGAAFSLGQGVTPVVEAVVVVLVVWLLAFSGRASRTGTPVMQVGLGLLLGGAVGNLSDRLFRHIPGHHGAVIDFIDAVRIGDRDWWPVFNVADASIVVGVVVVVLAYVRQRPARGSGG
jgi:signal peptidase II